MTVPATNDHKAAETLVNSSIEIDSTMLMSSLTMSEYATITDHVTASLSQVAANINISDLSTIVPIMHELTNYDTVQVMRNEDLTRTLISTDSTVTDAVQTVNDKPIDSSITILMTQSSTMVDSTKPESKYCVSTIPKMITSVVDLPKIHMDSVMAETSLCTVSKSIITTDDLSNVNKGKLYDPLSTTCDVEYDPEDPAMNLTPEDLFATDLDLSDDTEQLFHNIVQFDLPVSMSQSSYGKMTEEVCQRVALTSILPQLKKRKIDLDQTKQKDVGSVTESSSRNPVNKRKVPKSKSGSSSVVLASVVESGSKENAVCLLSSDDDMAVSKSLIQVTPSPEEKNLLPVKTKVILNEVKVCLIDISNKLNIAKPILINDDRLTDVEPDSDMETVPVDKDSKVAGISQSVKKPLNPAKQVLPVNELSNCASQSQASEKPVKTAIKSLYTAKASVSVGNSILSAKAPKTKTKDHLTSTEKKLKSANDSLSEKLLKRPGQSRSLEKLVKTSSKSLPTDKTSKSVVSPVPSDKTPKMKNDSPSIEKKSKSVSGSICDELLKYSRQSESVERLVEPAKKFLSTNRTSESVVNPVLSDKTTVTEKGFSSAEKKSTLTNESMSDDRSWKGSGRFQSFPKPFCSMPLIEEPNASQNSITTVDKKKHDEVPSTPMLAANLIESNGGTTDNDGPTKKYGE